MFGGNSSLKTKLDFTGKNPIEFKGFPNLNQCLGDLISNKPLTACWQVKCLNCVPSLSSDFVRILLPHLWCFGWEWKGKKKTVRGWPSFPHGSLPLRGRSEELTFLCVVYSTVFWPPIVRSLGITQLFFFFKSCLEKGKRPLVCIPNGQEKSLRRLCKYFSQVHYSSLFVRSAVGHHDRGFH